jgi:menaquinol-cytochrome c reductase cytochrome b/c subunit
MRTPTLSRFPILALVLPLSIACQGKHVNDILDLEGDPVAGQALYVDNCAGCHGDDAQGASGPNIVNESAEGEEFVEVVLSGEEEMPAFDGDLEDQEIADILAYVQALASGGLGDTGA